MVCLLVVRLFPPTDEGYLLLAEEAVPYLSSKRKIRRFVSLQAIRTSFEPNANLGSANRTGNFRDGNMLAEWSGVLFPLPWRERGG